MNKPTTFYITRHGQSQHNKMQLINGLTDSELTEDGMKQANDLAKELRKIDFDFVYSSDLLRAKRTAEIITLESKLELQTSKLLRERDYGDLEGKPYSHYKEWDEALKKLTNEEKFEYKHTHNMESDKEITERFLIFIREVSIRYSGKKILVVCHSNLIKAVLTKLGYGDYNNYTHGAIGNGAYLILESDGVDFFIKKAVNIKKVN